MMHSKNSFSIVRPRCVKKLAVIICTTLLLNIVDADYTFAVVPKRLNSPYWQAVKVGCETRAKVLSQKLSMNISCLFIGPAEGGPETEQNQIAILEELLQSTKMKIDGLALAILEAESGTQIINKFFDAGIPSVTFDSDAVDSNRLAYIGTDNTEMGKELGRVLVQVSDKGGKFGIIGAGSPNIQLRSDGVREGVRESKWVEVDTSIAGISCEGNPELAVELMHELVANHPDIGAIVPVGAWPMLATEAWQAFIDKNPNIINVCGDSLQQQVDLMNMGYGNALVGQLPFEMGKLVIDKLLEVKQAEEAATENNNELPFPPGSFFETNFLNVINIPRDLPPMVIDMNYIGSFNILGYIMCGFVVVLSLFFALWVHLNSKKRVVKASQPRFLLMICVGTLMMGLSIIPFSVDDQHFSQRSCDIACMSAPWLVSMGFTVTFSALFSKTWRVNKVFRNPNSFQRIQVSELDVLLPFALLFATNFIVLLCWSIFSPLHYLRQPHSSTDVWNRLYKSYYGGCTSSKAGESNRSSPYLAALLLVNFTAIVISSIQAYQARFIAVEFSESQYIAIAKLCILQAFLVGMPLQFLMREDPASIFLVQSTTVFFVCSSILLLIFAPKMLRMRDIESTKKLDISKRSNAPPQSQVSHLENDIISRFDEDIGTEDHEEDQLNFKVIQVQFNSKKAVIDSMPARSVQSNVE